MIQQAPSSSGDTESGSVPSSSPREAPPPMWAAGPTIWGLTPRELHRAFWHSRGVQCVWRGEKQSLQRAAELYLLLEPAQLVAFDTVPLCERLTWNNAVLARLRIVQEQERSYSERVVIDDRGLVQRVERRYRAQLRGSSRVIVTTSRQIAGLWLNARTRREGWDRARRFVPWARVDHWRCSGIIAEEGNPVQERELLDELVNRWRTPAQSIQGLEESSTGVWRLSGETIPDDGIYIGPLWMGRGAVGQDQHCVVGPHWIHDQREADPDDPPAAQVMPIAQVQEAVTTPRTPSSRQPGLIYPALKRALDLTASASALIVLLPIMLLIALMIVLEDGFPVFFGHRRQGRAGRPFQCLKFRTMHRNAEQIARQLEDYNVCDGPQVFIQNDPRVTRVGAWLRRTHLDELPQFLNVLVGQMSLVGPRPSPDEENRFCPAWRDSRLSVRPGITGLWQLKRRREPGEDFQEWIKYDIEYVQRANFWLDLKILVRTAWIMVKGRPDRATD